MMRQIRNFFCVEGNDMKKLDLQHLQRIKGSILIGCIQFC